MTQETWDIDIVDGLGRPVTRYTTVGWVEVRTFVHSLPDGQAWLRAWVHVNSQLEDARFGVLTLRVDDPCEMRIRRVDLLRLQLDTM